MTDVCYNVYGLAETGIFIIVSAGSDLGNLALEFPSLFLQYFTTENEVKQMKELYLNAEMDVVKFTANDVIATSGVSTTGEWVPRENEGAPDYTAFA